MAHQLIVKDTITGECGLADPVCPAISTDPNNILTLGTDGETFLDCTAVKGCETVTSISYDASTYEMTFLDENGDSTVVNLAALAADIFVTGATYDATTGVLTLTDNDASTPDVIVNLSALISQLQNNNDGTYTHTSGDGSVTTINVLGDGPNNLLVASPNGGVEISPATVAGVFNDCDGNPLLPGDEIAKCTDTGAQLIDATDGSIQVTSDVDNNYTLSAKMAYSDGSPVYADLPAFEAAAIASDCPIGGTVHVPVADGTLMPLPDGSQIGDRLNISFTTGGNYDEMLLQGTFTGLGRNLFTHGIGNITNNSLVRSGETYQFVWDGAAWCVIDFDYRLFSGPGFWRENEDGKTTIWGPFLFPIGSVDTVVTAPLPVAVINPEVLEVQVTDIINSADVAIGDMVGVNNVLDNAAVANFAHMVQQHTPTTLALLFRISANNPPINDGIRRVSIHIENAILDYAAL